MIRFFTLALLAVFTLAANSPAQSKSSAPAKDACTSCHASFAKVLPKDHPEVKGTGLGSCTDCHSLDAAEAKPDGFATRIHLAHTAPKGKLECTACHTYVAGKSFGLIGQKVNWGAPKDDDFKAMKETFTSWATSSNTDKLHAKAKVDCAGCHGKQLPVIDSTVENARCLACHGPLEKLAAKSEPKDFPKRNPHKSHLGDIACTVCHHGHSASAVYCLDCHRNFKMTIVGADK